MFAEEGIEIVLINEVLDTEIFDFFKTHNIKTLYRALTPTVEHSREAERLGADIIIATGFSSAEGLRLFRTLPAFYRTLRTEMGSKLAELEEQKPIEKPCLMR